MAWFCSIGPRVLPMHSQVGFSRCLPYIKASAQRCAWALHDLDTANQGAQAAALFNSHSFLSHQPLFGLPVNLFYLFKFRTQITLMILKCLSNLRPVFIYISRWTFQTRWCSSRLVVPDHDDMEWSAAQNVMKLNGGPAWAELNSTGTLPSYYVDLPRPYTVDDYCLR